MESIRYSAPHLRERIDKILDLSKIEAGEQEVNETETNIPDLFNNCISMGVELAKQAGISVKSANQYNLPHLLADESMIRQVLMNLLPNAIKFTPNGGNISSKAMLDENDRLLFEVTDTGIGIAKNGYDKALSAFGQVGNILIDLTTHKTEIRHVANLLPKIKDKFLWIQLANYHPWWYDKLDIHF